MNLQIPLSTSNGCFYPLQQKIKDENSQGCFFKSARIPHCLLQSQVSSLGISKPCVLPSQPCASQLAFSSFLSHWALSMVLLLFLLTPLNCSLPSLIIYILSHLASHLHETPQDQPERASFPKWLYYVRPLSCISFLGPCFIV